MKNERTVYTTRSCFPFTLFSSCNRKNENGYNGSYFYFSFFVWGLEKRKRMLGYPFSIFYYEIEKRKTKGRYIHGPFRFVNVLYREHKYQSTSDGLIGKQTQDGLVPYLFSRLNDTKRESNRRHVQERLFFCFFLIWCCKWKMKIGTADHISIFPFLFLN